VETIRTVQLPSGEFVPALGQGTWRLGENPSTFDDEVAALRLGVELGMTLIDTAEMYVGSAEVIRKAIAGHRHDCFIVDKVLPSHATRRGTIAVCERRLRELVTDHLDILVLHWRGSVPLFDTVDALEQLARDGKIRYWGVSNFDTAEMHQLFGLPEIHPQTDQVLYNLTDRGAEWSLLPLLRVHRMPLMAYSPLDEGALRNDPHLRGVAARHGATPAQIALAWVLRYPDVIAIPKAANPIHVRENRAALDIALTASDLEQLDRVFEAPRREVPIHAI
jgi:diketogulonate reductase-like aldo/keto reductase